jgi:hypothetical protein
MGFASICSLVNVSGISSSDESLELTQPSFKPFNISPLVTLKGETYTPTGDTRVNFVGHGNDLSQEGAQSLADKVKILQQTYGNDR